MLMSEVFATTEGHVALYGPAQSRGSKDIYD